MRNIDWVALTIGAGCLAALVAVIRPPPSMVRLLAVGFAIVSTSLFLFVAFFREQPPVRRHRARCHPDPSGLVIAEFEPDPDSDVPLVLWECRVTLLRGGWSGWTRRALGTPLGEPLHGRTSLAFDRDFVSDDGSPPTGRYRIEWIGIEVEGGRDMTPKLLASSEFDFKARRRRARLLRRVKN